jgi:gamma-polyglutamate synthase
MTDDILWSFVYALDAEIPQLMRKVSADLRAEVMDSLGPIRPVTCAERASVLIDWTLGQFTAIEGLHDKAAQFNARWRNASDEAEQHAAILDLAQQLGADRRKLERDEKAFDRFFDADAVLERYRRRVGERERAAAYGFIRASEFMTGGLADGSILPDAPLLTERFAGLLATGRMYRGDARVRHASHRAMRILAERGGAKLSGFWIDLLVRDTRRIVLNPEEDIWIQCDGLAILLVLSPISLKAVLDRRLMPSADRISPLSRDNRLFMRRELATLLVNSVGDHPEFDVYLRRLANDTDGAVRQALAFAIPSLPVTLFPGYYAKLRVDRDPQVRAALLAEPGAMAQAAGGERYLAQMERLFGQEKDEFVLRMALFAAQGFVRWRLECEEESKLTDTVTRLRAAISDLRIRTDNTRVRRWAGEAGERIWLLGDTEAQRIATLVGAKSPDLREGESMSFAELRGADSDTVGRVLSALAQNDFGFDYTPGRRPRLRRGDRFQRRLWRILHELRNSATDKRQAWLHTIGRVYSGSIAAPPAHMAELAPTKVPGEPLHQSGDSGWRNYLPLLDHVLSVVDRGGSMRLFTSEGVTTITARKGLWSRFRSFHLISWRFNELAALRNKIGSDYVTALRAHGLQVAFAPHDDGGNDNADPNVTRFFDVGGVGIFLGYVLQNALTYFETVFQNSLGQLIAFIGLASLWFFGRHIWRAREMRRLRGGVSLVLGGWGTRGKSGTERLKAGLISALGHPLVSKTTGCEAMFLHGTAFSDVKEMFLFRPYDKATIWEQVDLLRITRGVGGRVFLWECMGLTPSYVKVLQRDWMRDDISTITNTYPDHEDVQGPAGRNIPEVMTQFIPEDSLLLTTEEEMLPILQEGAKAVNTRLRPVTWREAGLIHQSLLDRFPYAEHPFNIALVTAMADEMGLQPDYAIKEMSDRVVADLGVLKIYPRSKIDGRTLEYVMGNSANERFGAMGNWQRMGFEHHDLGVDPEIYVSTVVNNRADRVPRSRVFARILVEDIAADRHILIGSNIDGLLGFINEAWSDYSATLTLYEEGSDPLATFEAMAKRQRVPLNLSQVTGRLAAMLADHKDKIAPDAVRTAVEAGQLSDALQKAGVPTADEVISHYEEQIAQCTAYEALRDRIDVGGDHARNDSDVRTFLRNCFMAKLVPVREYYIPGEDIVRLVARHTPPGLVNRIMGMQNIKGTGLDFVYRWQAWEACYKACQQALDNDPGIAVKGIDFLSGFQEYGALSEAHVRATLALLKDNVNAAAGQVEAITQRLDSQLASLDHSANETASGSGGGRFASVAEAFLDSSDAVRRRRAADRIYDDMIEEQISSQRAALELKKLTTRQKGGWFANSMGVFAGRLTALLPRNGQI